MEENVQQKNSSTSIRGNTHFLAAVNSLLESITDKDKTVRDAIEQALVRMAEKRPNEALVALCDYRIKHPKMAEQQISLILRVIERFTLIHTKELNDEVLKIVIDLTGAEITKTQDRCEAIQKPGLEILVSIGRIHCDKVMDSLSAQLQQGNTTHFMILQSMGTLATANISGIITFIKPTLITILPTLGMVKLDYVKQAYAFAIGHFAEAITEHLTQEKSNVSPEDGFHTEIAIAYDVFMHQWLPNREPKVSADILQALSHMYPLLPPDTITEQTATVIPLILRFYRRSMDRNAITQLLAAVLKTSIDNDGASLDAMSDTIIASLFDLVCVNPDYEKPQTVKGHYEVLRCFDLLIEIYSTKIFDMLLVQMRSNNERERIKSLLVLTHSTNKYDHMLRPKIQDFTILLKTMIYSEKTCKVKMVLLKTIVALAQKALICDPHFIKFILRHCCALNKHNHEYGTIEEQSELIQACSNSLYILATTVLTMDDILKQELLQAYLQLDHTSVCNTIAKCLSKLFARKMDLSPRDETPTEEEAAVPITVAIPEAIFVRSIILMGNTNETKRSENILLFLKHYCPVLNKHLRQVWLERIPELISLIPKPDEFIKKLYQFVMATIKDVDDFKFAEVLSSKTANQLSLYPQLPLPLSQQSEYVIPNQQQERGMLLKILGIILCYVTDVQTIDAMIDLIINASRQEKLDKNAAMSEYVSRLSDASKALGFISKVHLDLVLKKLDHLVQDEGSRKSSGSFFSGLNFMKDSVKETDIYKINLLAIETYKHIVQMAPANLILKDIDRRMVNYLSKEYAEAKDFTMKNSILCTLLAIAQEINKAADINCPMQSRSSLMAQLFSIDLSTDNLPLFPNILKLATVLMKIGGGISTGEQYQMEVHDYLEHSCGKFFTNAQQLKSKFDSAEDDDRNSFLAKYLNLSLPELNSLVETIFEQSPTPATLDEVYGVLEFWIKNRNSEVRICAGHLMNHALRVYIKTVKIGCEAPAKFNQSGTMLAAIVPRCIDSNATVRQTSIEILQKILEISCIYESLTIADSNTDWVKDLQQIKMEITTDDSKEIYRMTGELARIIALRLSNFQYLQFCKSLLHTLNDTEQSSAIGSSVVLKFFIQIKGAELFHAIPEFIKEALQAISMCQIPRAKSGVTKSLVALTKHHPKLVSSEMLGQQLPIDENIKEYWRALASDVELCGTILDNFLNILSSSCVYESSDTNDRQNIASIQPFAIHCALLEILPCRDIQAELQKRFAEIFCLLITSLATYTNLAPPMFGQKSSPTSKHDKTTQKSKFGFIPNKDAIKMNPCAIVLESFQSFLINLSMEQIAAVLTVCPYLASSTELNNFMEILTPMAVGLVNQLGIGSALLGQTVTVLSKYVSSPYDPQRIAAVGLFSQLIPLKPAGEISSVIMLHLNSALNDPNPLVRGFCIRGLAYVAQLSEHDIDKYWEISLSALLKGVDDFNDGCLINVPLESMLGLSRILTTLPHEKLENFQVSLAIRIRPFFENTSAEIREAAILLFGDLCQSKLTTIIDDDDDDEANNTVHVSEALREQLFTNFFSMLLHLSETNLQIVRACKVTLRKVCAIINAPKVNTMVQSHLLEHGQLHYDIFIANLVKLIGEELSDNIPDFIESCLPFLKSKWTEIRGNAAIIIGLLHNLNKTNQQTTENVGQKLAVLLRDDQISVRIKASHALGYMFGDLL